MLYTVPDDLDVEGYTLIIPSACVGNVGQLAVDLLIASLNDVEHVGSLGHESVLPFSSGNPFEGEEDELTTAIEVYRSVRNKVVIIQVRASLISKTCEEDFVDELLKWFLHHKFSRVIILTSTYAYEKLDCQIQDPRIRYIISPLANEKFGQQLSNLNCKELEPRQTDSSEDLPGLQGRDFFHGASYAKCLFSKCVQKDIPCVIFLTFSVDGDNIPEGTTVAELVDNLIPMVAVDDEGKKMFKHPPSWSHLYGNDPPDGLY